MNLIVKVTGFVIWIGAGILMFIFWLTAMTKWLGFFGTILAFILTPGFIIFPLIFWIVEGVFPVFYFILLGIGIIGLIIASIPSKN